MQKGTGCSLGKRQPIVTILFRLIVGLSYLTLTSCSNNVEEVSKPLPRKGPTITQSSPSDGEIDFSVVAPLVVTFDKDLSPGSVNSDSITVTTNGTAVISSVRYDDTTKQAIITPSDTLTHATEYTITVNPTITDQQNNPLRSAQTIVFTTTSKQQTWARSYRGDRTSKILGIVPLKNGDHILYGEVLTSNTSIKSRWIAKSDLNGLLLWQKAYPSSDNLQILSVIKITESHFVAVGYNSPNDSFIFEFDTNGNILWSKSISNLSIQDIEITDNGFMLAGNLNSRAWIARFDNLGTPIWSKHISDDNYSLTKISKTLSGDFIAAGMSNFSPTVDGDIWIVKIDSIGNILRQEQVSTNNSVRIKDIKATENNGLIIVGSKANLNNSGTTAIAIQINNLGEIIWYKELGDSSTGYNIFNAVLPAKPNGFVLAGEIADSNSSSAWIIKLAESGQVDWNTIIHGENFDTLHSINHTKDGDFVVSGYTGSLNGWLDALAFKFDLNGNTNLVSASGLSFSKNAIQAIDVLSTIYSTNQFAEDSPTLLILNQPTTISEPTNLSNENLSGNVGVLTAPSNLSVASNIAGQVKLNWLDNENNESGYILYRSTDTLTYTRTDTTTPIESGITEMDVTGLVANVTYYFKITAYNENGYSDFSNTVSVLAK